MPDLDVDLPAGFSLTSYEQRPDLIRAADAFNSSVWPDYMLQDADADKYWNLLETVFREFQLLLLDGDGQIAATNNSAPLAWDGTDEGLPDGWDRQFEQTALDLERGTAVNTLGALQIVVDPARRGAGSVGGDGQGHASERAGPWLRPRHRLRPADGRYAFWTRADGQPFDPWIRLHVRLGGRIVRASPRSMAIRGTIAEWELWTGIPFPESALYILPVATNPLEIDRERDEGVYYDANVWVVHTVD